MSDHLISGNARLHDCPDCPVGARWPIPVHRRLESLVERAHDHGERTTLKELLAAIVCNFDLDADELASVLKRYRKSTAADVELVEVDASSPIHVVRRGPGRPRNRTAG